MSFCTFEVVPPPSLLFLLFRSFLWQYSADYGIIAINLPQDRGVLLQGGAMPLDYIFEDGLFYLNGTINHWDLTVRNACGFISLDDAGKTAKHYGYKLSWET